MSRSIIECMREMLFLKEQEWSIGNLIKLKKAVNSMKQEAFIYLYKHKGKKIDGKRTTFNCKQEFILKTDLIKTLDLLIRILKGKITDL